MPLGLFYDFSTIRISAIYSLNAATAAGEGNEECCTSVGFVGDPSPRRSEGLGAWVDGLAGINDLGEGVSNLVEVIRRGEGVDAGLVGLSGLRAGIAGLVGVDSLRGVNTDCLAGGDILRGDNAVDLVGVLHGFGVGSESGLREFVVVWVSFECNAP